MFSSRLAHTVEQGERLYSSSEGKVQDEYSRALLRASIDKRDEKAIADAMDKVNASIDAKTKADEERKAQEEAAAAAAAQAQSTPGTATVLVHALRLRFGPGFRPVRRRIPFLRRFRRLDRWFRVSGLVGARRTRTPRNCPAPTRAYERTNTMPQLTTLIPSFAGTRHRPRVAGGRARRVPDAPRSAIRIRNGSPTPAARCR